MLAILADIDMQKLLIRHSLSQSAQDEWLYRVQSPFRAEQDKILQ
jgi:hypothetical protein